MNAVPGLLQALAFPAAAMAIAYAVVRLEQWLWLIDDDLPTDPEPTWSPRP